MRQIAGFALGLMLIGTGGIPCFAQSKPMAAMKQPGGIQPSSATDTGVPLTYPYSISTEPHFAVFVEFPKADSIRRIALGDSNYFLAEADKRSEEHTSELQSLTNLVCRLLLEKKKETKTISHL